tara:strand:+ start:1055 stop:1489 length:435 start_codon:yes stop_codon:yes gene_type:complete
MFARICRQYYQDQTHGTLTVYNEDTEEEVFNCRTLELPWLDNQTNISCIPEGHYDVDPVTSQTFGRIYAVNEVPGRSLIRIHQGNYAGSINPRTGHSDIRGCILVGKEFVDISGDGIADITSSKATLKELLEVAPGGFILTVEQ